jgi:hypothetical protein
MTTLASFLACSTTTNRDLVLEVLSATKLARAGNTHEDVREVVADTSVSASDQPRRHAEER